MSTTQRKRRGGAVNSRQARKRNRLMASSSAGRVSEAEPIELEESAVEEVVDLTGESSDPVVIDLTRNDSVVIVEETQRQRRNPRRRGQRQPDICIVISDEEEEPRNNDVPSGTVSCPICMDGYSEIVQSGRLIASTICGHVFCSHCLCESLRNANFCPKCRTALTHTECHPIYI